MRMPTPVAIDREAVADAIAGDIGRSNALDDAGLAVVAALTTDRLVAGPLGAGLGHAIDGAARAVAVVADRGLRKRLAIGEIDLAIDMGRGSIAGMAGIARR